jgi:uncharacterized protein
VKRALRAAFLVAGFAFLGIAVLGLVLPVLPATPFLLLAAACFARSSQRFYDWLVNHRSFGPLVREWREHGAIPWRTKLWAIALMSGSLAVSVVFFVEDAYLQWVLAAIGVLLAAWLYSIPSRDR